MSQIPPRPDAPNRPQPAWRKLVGSFRRELLVGLVALIAVGIVVGLIAYNTAGSGGGGSVSGQFVRWQPVDSAHGYAVIRLTNSSSDEATAKCTVEVSTDFGDMGWDYLDQPIGPNQTRVFNLPLTVQNQSALEVTSGTVKNC